MSGVATALRATGRLCRIAGLATATIVRAQRQRAGDAVAQMQARSALFARSCRTALRIQGLEVEVSGPRPSGPALIVSNHLSYLDPIIIAAHVDCVPISKSDLAGWPLLGSAARRCGVIFVERGSTHSRLAVMREAERVLRDGGMVLNFPEGTTTDGSTLLQYRKGLFGVAQALGLPVFPAAITYLPRDLAWIGDDTFVPHYLRLSALRTAYATLAFGEPLASRDFARAEDLAEAAHARTLTLLGRSRGGLRKAD
jgi:1-acyl-sn-glycerol-3-phosphate acyltransferase